MTTSAPLGADLDDAPDGPVFDTPVSARARRLQAVLAVVLTVAGIALLVFLLSPDGSGSTRSEAGALPTAPVVLVSGPAFATPDERGVTRLDAALADLDVPGLAETHPDAGFSRGLPALGRLAADDLPGRDLSLVVVQGGELDVDESTKAVRFGAETLVDRVRALVSPSTLVVLVGPVPDAEGASIGEQRVRDILQDVAQLKGTQFVDPIELGWVHGDASLPQDFAEAIRPLLPV